MIINMIGGGGGAGLNFKVVGGTSAPAQPSENTIWVNTDTEIASWVFSATQPTGAEGLAWIKTDDNGLRSFNALKKNGITLYPTSAKQYQSGAWVIKPMKIYQNGAWQGFEQYLFNLGDQIKAVTGGWAGYAVRLASGSSGAQLAEAPLVATRSDGSIKLYNDYGGGIYRCVNKIDLTAISTITLNGEMYNHNANRNWCSLYVWSSIGTYYPDNAVASIGPSNTKLSGDIVLDVNHLNGSYYIGFGLHDNTNDNYIIMNSLVMS